MGSRQCRGKKEYDPRKPTLRYYIHLPALLLVADKSLLRIPQVRRTPSQLCLRNGAHDGYPATWLVVPTYNTFINHSGRNAPEPPRYGKVLLQTSSFICCNQLLQQSKNNATPKQPIHLKKKKQNTFTNIQNRRKHPPSSQLWIAL